ncbi:hypothetical protein [Paraburkholderia elongata]|uniref:hypothetical protein n=1 Tax=Paraburkholderia elongata TaxID=2675747 RepID=UPI001C12D22A|nr:hypothetical protein [Paraburkholderia elongata]
MGQILTDDPPISEKKNEPACTHRSRRPGIVILSVLRWYFRLGRTIKAANNAVVAKLTLSHLDNATQSKVVGRALAIGQDLRGGITGLNLSEVQELLLTSLAMLELGTPPAYKRMKLRHVIRNPFLAVVPHRRVLCMLSRAVGESEGIDLTIDDRDPMIAELVSRLNKQTD